MAALCFLAKDRKHAAVGISFAGNFPAPDLTPSTNPATEVEQGKDAENVAVIQADRLNNSKTFCGLPGRQRFESIPLAAIKNRGVIISEKEPLPESE